MSDPSPVLARVRKLLALAGSSNVHEAAAAAAAAQALVERHRLAALLAAQDAAEAAADDPTDPVTDGREAPLHAARRLRRWQVALAAALARVNGCLAYTMPRGDETLLLLVGRAEDRAAVAELWGWLVTRLEWLSATHGAGRSRAWHDAFRIGAAEVIAARLAAVGAEAATEAEATVPAAMLARVEPARVARAAAVDAFAARHLRLGSGRGLRVDARGFARGREAGAALPLPSHEKGPSRGKG